MTHFKEVYGGKPKRKKSGAWRIRMKGTKFGKTRFKYMELMRKVPEKKNRRFTEINVIQVR